MSLRNKIAQMLIMGFDGSTIHDKSLVTQWLQQDGLGGVILFDYDLTTNTYGKNIVNRVQIKTLNERLRYYANHSLGNEDKLPLLIAIDYEGGAVDRLKKIEGCAAPLKACEQAKLSSKSFSEEIEKMALTLVNLGFNLNFAPVVDLDLCPEKGIIGQYGRSFSANAKTVSDIASQFVKIFNDHGIACAYKHFPGHGSADGDSHVDFVDVTETYQRAELEPYLNLQQLNLPVMVMTAHVINRQLDASGLPATLSSVMLTDILRKQLGFQGVIISDDLQMHAISQYFEFDDVLTKTINAGADMLIFGNQLGNHNATEVIDCIERLVESNTIPLARIEQAYDRIVYLKKSQMHLSS